MSDLNPLSLGNLPEDYTELEDGSIEVPLDSMSENVEGNFDENLAEVLEDRVLNLSNFDPYQRIEMPQTKVASLHKFKYHFIS